MKPSAHRSLDILNRWSYTQDALGDSPEALFSAADIDQRDDLIGHWLSAALEDPLVCQEMKSDILKWMESSPRWRALQIPIGEALYKPEDN